MCLLKPISPQTDYWLRDNVLQVSRYPDGAIEASKPFIGQIVEELADEGFTEDTDYEVEE